MLREEAVGNNLGQPFFSATQWIFGSESIAATAARLARLGYRGIEPAAEPDRDTLQSIRAAVEPHGLEVPSLCGIYTPERDLSHPDREIRDGGIRYVDASLRLAAALGARTVIVVPTAVGRVTPASDRESEWQWAVESLQHLAETAEEVGVGLAIEALNRYESYLVNSLAAAVQLARAVDSPAVGIMADLFHMNIEEPSLGEALRQSGPLLRHVHLADSNRRPPGQGHTDFAVVIGALREIGYTGPLTMEFLPPTSNPYLAASLDVPEEEKTNNARQAIEYVRTMAERPA